MPELTKREYFALEILKQLLAEYPQQIALAVATLPPEQVKYKVEQSIESAAAIAEFAADRLIAKLDPDQP